VTTGTKSTRNFRQSPDCELKVLCDASESRLAHMRRLYPELATTHKFEDLLNDSQLDAVVIATPVRFHYTMAKAALLTGSQKLEGNGTLLTCPLRQAATIG